jgi:uncharacterized protein
MSETRQGMAIDWDVPIEMDDGLALRADVFRPVADGRHPVILSYGPYGKWLHFEDGQTFQWNRMREKQPDTVRGTSNEFQSWEVVDPEKWVPHGYVCVRVDSRGAGRSPGRMDLQSPREVRDLYECIEWAAARSWSNGKVGLNGISYYASNQWHVAALRPPHLAAICVWEGASDPYREVFYHGGILSTFRDIWFKGRVLPRQHGVGARGHRSRFTGGWVAGPETLPDEVLNANRSEPYRTALDHPLIDDFWEPRLSDLSKIRVPLLSAANWGGAGLHLRGNIEGFLNAGSEEKWLEVHVGEHWTYFYSDYGVDLQRRFFDHYLKEEENGWDSQPRVLLHIRHPGERFVVRGEDEWPLGRTRWTKLYPDPRTLGLSTDPVTDEHELAYEALGDGLTFLTQPLEEDTEITGPLAAKLFVSSDTEDVDVFVVVRLFTPDFREVTFQGSNEPHTPMAHGWLRGSHRRLDPERSLDYRPYHTHVEHDPLVPGEVYELDIEIWPTSIVAPKGYRLALSVRGRDYVYPGSTPQPLPVPGQSATSGAGFTGVGPFRHTSPENRPPAVFSGTVRLHWSPDRQPHLLAPIIPPA